MIPDSLPKKPATAAVLFHNLHMLFPLIIRSHNDLIPAKFFSTHSFASSEMALWGWMHHLESNMLQNKTDIFPRAFKWVSMLLQSAGTEIHSDFALMGKQEDFFSNLLA